MRRSECLVTHDMDFAEMHGALLRWTSDHRITDIHAGILILSQADTDVHNRLRIIDAFFAAELPNMNELYNYQPVGGWTRYRLAHTYP